MKGKRDVVTVTDLKKFYPVRRGLGSVLTRGEQKFVQAVDGISFAIKEGETLSLAGESGCGKTTTGELILRLQEPTSGQINILGEDITKFNKKKLKDFRRTSQMIFQDPYETLNPRFSIFQTIVEPLVVHKIGDKKSREELVFKTLESVGLKPPEQLAKKYSHEISGGQRQRVAIARAMVLSPTFLVADEPTSMLDVSVRASILNLLKDLREQFNLTMLYISHDFATIWCLADRTAIMYLGKIVELGSTDTVIEKPLHPYTRALISAVSTVERNRERVKISGDIPSAIDLPPGCRFHPRCKEKCDKCNKTEPTLQEVEKDHYVSCLLHE